MRSLHHRLQRIQYRHNCEFPVLNLNLLSDGIRRKNLFRRFERRSDGKDIVSACESFCIILSRQNIILAGCRFKDHAVRPVDGMNRFPAVHHMVEVFLPFGKCGVKGSVVLQFFLRVKYLVILTCLNAQRHTHFSGVQPSGSLKPFKRRDIPNQTVTDRPAVRVITADTFIRRIINLIIRRCKL